MNILSTHRCRGAIWMAMTPFISVTAQGAEPIWGEHSFAGSACEAVNGNYPSQVVGATGTLSNRSTSSSLRVSCPMDPPGWPTLDDPQYLHVEAFVTKKTSAAMTCALIRNGRYSTDGSSFRSITHTGPGAKHYDFGVVSWEGHGRFTLRCDIPPAATDSASTRTSIDTYSYHQRPDDSP